MSSVTKWCVAGVLVVLSVSNVQAAFVNGVDTFDGPTRDINTWKLWENHPNEVFSQDDAARLDSFDYDPRFNSRCTYVTLDQTVGVGETLRVDVTYNEQMDSYGLGGIMLTSDNVTLDGLNMASYVMLINVSSGWGNNIAAGYKPLGGSYSWNDQVVGSQQPVGSTYVYEIDRLSSTSAAFSVYDSDGTTLLGSTTVNFSNIQDDLYICLYTLQCDMTYDNVTIPEPATMGLLVLGGFFLRRRDA